MKAMVLAAGLGTRLGELTRDKPKALVEINGRTLLEIALERLKGFGIREVIVNSHHFADQVDAYLAANAKFGMRVEVSREEVLLDTGGGLKKAAWFFRGDGGAGEDEPFVLHNVDVLSTIDLGRMREAHRKSGGLATLAVMKRESSRQLLFDEKEGLCGRQIEGRVAEVVRRAARMEALAFSGVHLISPRLLDRIKEHGVFSIIDVYLRLAGSGEKIQAFRADEFYWRDLGRPEDLKQAAEHVRRGLISL